MDEKTCVKAEEKMKRVKAPRLRNKEELGCETQTTRQAGQSVSQTVRQSASNETELLRSRYIPQRTIQRLSQRTSLIFIQSVIRTWAMPSNPGQKHVSELIWGTGSTHQHQAVEAFASTSK